MWLKSTPGGLLGHQITGRTSQYRDMSAPGARVWQAGRTNCIVGVTQTSAAKTRLPARPAARQGSRTVRARSRRAVPLTAGQRYAMCPKPTDVRASAAGRACSAVGRAPGFHRQQRAQQAHGHCAGQAAHRGVPRAQLLAQTPRRTQALQAAGVC